MTNYQNEILKAAEMYMGQNFSLIPVNPSNKKACIPWKEYQTRQPALVEIEQWLEDFPNMALAVVTGKESDLVIIDFDSTQAVAMVEALGIMDTPLVKTRRGVHAYFNYCKGIKNKQKIGFIPDTDIRGEGGYAILPPSIVSGFKYSWINGKGLDETVIDDFPNIIHQNLKTNKTSMAHLLKGVPKGQRTSSGLIILGSYINQGYSRKSVENKLTQWNQKCAPPKDNQKILKMVEDIWSKDQKSKKPAISNNSSGNQPLINSTFTVSNSNYAKIPTGRYLLELKNIGSSSGFVERLDFIFSIQKHQNDSRQYKNKELTAFVNVPQNQKARSDSKLTMWAAVLLNKPVKQLNTFKPSDLIGQKCWGDIELNGNTNRIKNIYPCVTQSK